MDGAPVNCYFRPTSTSFKIINSFIFSFQVNFRNMDGALVPPTPAGGMSAGQMYAAMKTTNIGYSTGKTTSNLSVPMTPAVPGGKILSVSTSTANMTTSHAGQPQMMMPSHMAPISEESTYGSMA